MKKTILTGEQIKRDNGSGYRLSDSFPGRRFHDRVNYVVRWHGVNLDGSTVGEITRAR